MSQLNIFQANIFKQSYVEHIIIDGEPWFKAKQVAVILEYKDEDQAIRRHVDEEDKKRLDQVYQGSQNNGLGIYGNQIMINESGLYSLVLRSKKKEAIDFKRWITSQVLPSIRRTGKYETEELKLKLEQANKTIDWYTEHQVVTDPWHQRLPPKEKKYIPKKLTEKELKQRIIKDMLPILNNPFDYIYVPRD